MKSIYNSKKILIVGDAGRGKSTLADYLSKKMNIEHIDLDDIFWKEKFTIKRNEHEKNQMVNDILKQKNS